MLVIDSIVKLVGVEEHELAEQEKREHQAKQMKALEEEQAAKLMEQEEEEMAALDAGGWVVVEADVKTM